MKVNEYLSSKRAAGELLEKKYKKAAKKFPLTTAVFCILIGGMLFGATRLPQNASDVISTDSFVEYERSALGNAVINSLNNGVVADNALGYTEETEDGIKIVSKDGECLIPLDASNINITDKGVFFRDNSNISYCFLKYGESYKDYYKDTSDDEVSDDGSTSNSSEEGVTDSDEDSDAEVTTDAASDKDKANVIIGQVILDAPCGNCIVSNKDTLYLINFSKNSHVYSYDLNGKNEKEFIDEPVRSFAMLENATFYLDYDNILVKLNENGDREYSLEKIDKFYLNGDLFIQNNDKVIKLNLNNENGEIIAEGIEELLGVTDSSIYYSKDNKVYERDISGGNETVFSQGKNYYEGVYKNNGKVVAVGDDL